MSEKEQHEKEDKEETVTEEKKETSSSSSSGNVNLRKRHATTSSSADMEPKKSDGSTDDDTSTSSSPSSPLWLTAGDVDQFSGQVHVYMAGLFDSLSYHRTLPIIVNHTEVMIIIGKIFAANAVLILGSVALFEKGIMPMLQFFEKKVGDEAVLDDQNTSTLWFIYQLLWLTPICVLCYVLCLTWYQELADCIHKIDTLKAQVMNKEDLQKSKSDMKSVTKSIEYVLYATLTWLFIFVQNQLLLGLFPMISRSGVHIIERVMADEITVEGQVIVTHGLKQLVKVGFSSLCHAMTYLSLGLGLILMAILYGWYAFDPKWIANQMNPDERFQIIERHLAYFIGFGTPYVLLNKCTSFFIGFGTFLMVFPFCIMLGTMSDYQAPYKQHEVKATQRYRVFKLAQVWTLSSLKFLGTDVEKTQKLLEQQKQKRLLAAAKANTTKASSSSTTTTAAGAGGGGSKKKTN